jgi:hypothetical protein
MNSFREQIIQGWYSIQQKKLQEPGYYHIRLETGKLYEIRCGINFPQSKPTIFIGILKGLAFSTFSDQRTMSESSGMTILPISAENFDKNYVWLAMICKNEDVESIFLNVVEDLYKFLKECDNVTSSYHLSILLLSRIKEWQHFFAFDISNRLSFEQQLGLWGELTIINKLFTFDLDVSSIVNGWQGPNHSSKDFLFDKFAIEVKTNIKGKKKIQISSIEQLDSSDTPQLFLALVIVTISKLGKSLPEIIQETRNLIKKNAEVEAKFENLLLKIGYIDLYTNEYSERFSLEDIKLYPINEYFPRIQVKTQWLESNQQNMK